MLNKKGKRGKANQDDEEYIPKAFRKNRKKEDSKNQKSEKKNKKGKKKASKRKLKKFLLIVFVAVIIIGGISLGISANRWKTLAKEMLANENSIVVDIDGNKIATLGCEKKNLTISFDNMPNNLKNAYVSIEDERFYSHGGIDIKRTGRCYFILHNSFWKILLWWKHYYATTGQKLNRRFNR